jgi:ABC-type transport system substrate-binding protein
VARLENIPSLHIRAGFLKVGCGDILTRYDLRFRRALSLAVNRREINDAIFFGQAIEGQNTSFDRASSTSLNTARTGQVSIRKKPIASSI